MNDVREWFITKKGFTMGPSHYAAVKGELRSRGRNGRDVRRSKG